MKKQCDGQVNLFDFIPERSNLVRTECLFVPGGPCNILNAHDIARTIDIDCRYGCCKNCKDMESCGAACRYSRDSNPKPRFTRKICASTCKECDCYCGTDSTTNKCCTNCINPCKNRCEYSKGSYEVFNKDIKTWIRNPDYFNPTWQLVGHGTNIQGGKDRVRNYFVEKHTDKEKVQFLKSEHGIGGFGFPHKDKKNFVHDSMSGAKGIEIEYLDAVGENHEELITWEKVEKELSFLIGKGWY